MIGWIHYHGSGAYEHCTSVLRDMYYILVSEQLSLPYWPQVTRRDFASQFPNYLDHSARVQLYRRLADALKSTLTEVYDDQREEVAFVPPFSALVLERSQNKGQILRRLLEVRDEFSGLRENLTSIEQERLSAHSIGERLKQRQRQRELLNNVAGAFERPSVISLEGVVKYVPKVIEPAVNPTDPSKYSSELLLLPAKALVEWWRRRPIAKFFRLADKIKEMESYPGLLARHFGTDVRF